MEIHKSFYRYLKDFSEEEGDKRYLFDEDKTFTAKMTFEAVKNLANQLYRLGVRKGDVLSIRVTRSVQATLLFFASQCIGTLTCLTDAHDTAEHYIANSGVNIRPKWYISNEEESMDISYRTGWQAFGACEKTALSFDFPDRTEEEFPPRLELESPAVIIFTSGSTGKSKGVVLTQSNFVHHMFNTQVVGGYTRTDISGELLPLHHIFGLMCPIFALHMRYEMFYPYTVAVDYVAKCIEKYRFTRLDGVPSYALALARYKETNPFDSSSLIVALTGGAPATKEQFQYIEKTLGMKMIPVYGMSECISITGIPMDETEDNRCGTVGKFLPKHTAVIMDNDGNFLPCGEKGEICVKSPVVMYGYYGDKKATAETVVDGWLHTGDIGYVDEGGYVRISGRKKDIIIRHGNNMSSVDIEKKLLSLKEVLDVCVVGIPEKIAGEVPAALVVLRAGYVFDEAEFLKLSATVLNKNEIPGKVIFTNKIPLNAAGKPDKPAIKKTFLV